MNRILVALPRAFARSLSAAVALAWPYQALAVPAATSPPFPPPYVQSTLTSGNVLSNQVTNPITANLTAEFPLNEGSGTSTRDISGNGYTATFAAGGNAPAWGTWGIQFSNPGSFGITATWVQTTVKTWKTALVYACIGLPLGTTGTATGGLPVAAFPALFGTPANTDSVSLIAGATGNNLTNQNDGAWQMATFAPGFSTSNWKTRALAPVPSPCGVVAATLDTNDHLYFNGVEVAYSEQGAASAYATTTTTGYQIGDHNNASGEAFKGTIGYVVFYSTVLTPAQIAQETQFIRYQVENRPGFPIPVAKLHTSSPSIVGIGDSLTACYNGNAACFNSTYITPLTNSYTIYNEGIGGQFAATNLSIGAVREGAVLSDAAGRNVCRIWEGTNDVANGWTAANTALSIQAHAKQARAEGCDRVIVSTMISRTGQDTNKNSLNAYLRQQWHGFADMLDDLAAVPNIGADSAYNNTSSPACFNADHIHLTGPSGAGTCMGSLTGYAFVESQLAREINMLDGATLDYPTVTTSNAYTEADADNFLLQTPTAAATTTLIDCLGMTGIRRRITNGSGTYAITVSGSGSTTTITGSNSVAANTTAEFTCMLTGASSGGNYWLRTI
jgi:hypothetical protein